MTQDTTPFIIGVSISSAGLLLIIGLLLFFIIKRKRKQSFLRRQGKSTEDFVNQSVQFWSYKNKGMYIPGTMFKYNGNKIFEVDGILITQRALIAIEVKNIKAQTIFGKGYEKKWFKVLGNDKFAIKSPILQNDKHLDHIVKMTEMKIPMISLIIFESSSVNKIEITDIPSHALVIKTDEIGTTLDGINSILLPKITFNEVQFIFSKLMNHKTDSEDDRKLLISYAKEFDEKTFTI